MALILDIVLAGIFIVLVVSAAKKGFVLTILEVVAIIAALFCASYFSKPIAQGSYDMFLKGNIEKKINSEISEHQVPQNLGDVAFDSIPEYAVTFAECAGINVSKYLRAIVLNNTPKEDNSKQKLACRFCELYKVITNEGLQDNDELMKEVDSLCQILY